MQGRPKKAEGEVKGYTMKVRMTDEERAILGAAARVKSLSLSSWVRSELLALAKRLLAKERAGL
jgi:uncharacterized protein (DUF1778 family)